MKPRPQPVIQTERLTLRMARPADAPELLRFYRENEEFLAPWRPTSSPDAGKLEFWTAQIQTWQREWELDLGLRLWLFPRANPTSVLGHIGFTVVVRGPAQFCYLGYHLGRESEGHGYMYEALDSALTYAFDAMHLHRIMANYMPRNARSARLLERLGFGIDGFARDYLRIAGAWEDHVMTSKTNPSWREPER